MSARAFAHRVGRLRLRLAYRGRPGWSGELGPRGCHVSCTAMAPTPHQLRRIHGQCRRMAAGMRRSHLAPDGKQPSHFSIRKCAGLLISASLWLGRSAVVKSSVSTTFGMNAFAEVGPCSVPRFDVLLPVCLVAGGAVCSGPRLRLRCAGILQAHLWLCFPGVHWPPHS